MPTAALNTLAIPVPVLPTLPRKPSWVNRAGRVDRSACIELRASDIWRQVSDIDWRRTRSSSRDRFRIHRDEPARGFGAIKARCRPCCEASACFTITAPLLAALHDSRRAQQLVGDFRSVKSNAMNTHLRDHRSAIACNPNRGGTRVKMLGVWSGCDAGDERSPRLRTGWTQPVRIERWRLHARLAQHFLICPACSRKHLKLFMPLATKQEIADARIAEGWVKMLDARHIAACVPLDQHTARSRAEVINRYGLLFRDRQLCCRRCLGMRYGEIKWLRFKPREAALQAVAARQRCEDEAQRAKEDRAISMRLMFAIGGAMSAEHLNRAFEDLRRYRRKREARDRANARRRARRRGEFDCAP